MIKQQENIIKADLSYCWKLKSLLLFLPTFIISTIGLLLLNDQLVAYFNLDDFAIFDNSFDLLIIGLSYMFFVFPYRKISSLKNIYNLKWIKISPLFILASVAIVLLRVIVSNGINDIIIFYKNLDLNLFINFIKMTITSTSFLSTIILAPLWEEFLFRGVIFTIVWKRLNLFSAFLISGIFFAILHIGADSAFTFNHIFISTILLLFIQSCLFSYTFYRTKSLTITTLMHSFANITATLIYYLYMTVLV